MEPQCSVRLHLEWICVIVRTVALRKKQWVSGTRYNAACKQAEVPHFTGVFAGSNSSSRSSWSVVYVLPVEAGNENAYGSRLLEV
jgi:hypothetical protein